MQLCKWYKKVFPRTCLCFLILSTCPVDTSMASLSKYVCCDVGELQKLRASCPLYRTDDSYMQSMELSGISPRGGIFPVIQEGGSMPPMLGDGSTFSLSSILSAKPSQLIWKRVTRGLEAKIFLWSWNNESIGLGIEISLTIGLTFLWTQLNIFIRPFQTLPVEDFFGILTPYIFTPN